VVNLSNFPSSTGYMPFRERRHGTFAIAACTSADVTQHTPRSDAHRLVRRIVTGFQVQCCVADLICYLNHTWM
jgi:hypothetical protein